MKSPQPNRRSIRLQGYDYSQGGAYFLTICTLKRECLFGEIVEEEILLNDWGQVTQRCWHDIPAHFPQVELDAFVVMPNHIHGIMVIDKGTACRAPTGEQFGRPVPGSIPTIVRSFKAAVTKGINAYRQTPGEKLWQRNYWEHIIRNDREMNHIREYVQNNSAQWETDKLHPLWHSNQP